jgi:DNA-directed RNA polymerase specialized sigma24 family protein
VSATSRSRPAGRPTPVVPFQRFFEEHRTVVWRYLVATVGANDADDVFQETFLAALRGYDRRRASASGRAWVMTIAHHRAMDHHRGGARRAIPVDSLPELAHHDPEPADPDGPWALVRALPPKQRAAVTLRYTADLSHAEVARVLGTSEEAARRSAHEGLRKLRLELPA